MPTIRVKIDKFGNPVIATEGYTGNACEKATESLEAVLGQGADDKTNRRTPEFYNSTERHIRSGNR